MIPSVDTLRQLNDLPATFTRPGTPYIQLTDSINAGLSTFCLTNDAVIAQTFDRAQFGWLDTWGEIFNIPRSNQESDGIYRMRITRTLLAWVGTLPAIQQWALYTFGQSITVTENVDVGYNLTFPGGLTTVQIAAFLVSLGRIRPAGVPFTVVQQQIGLYLDTINFFDTSEVVGSYLTDDGVATPPSVSAVTNNSLPSIPEYYFADPTLNPGLQQ